MQSFHQMEEGMREVITQPCTRCWTTIVLHIYSIAFCNYEGCMFCYYFMFLLNMQIIAKCLFSPIFIGKRFENPIQMSSQKTCLFWLVRLWGLGVKFFKFMVICTRKTKETERPKPTTGPRSVRINLMSYLRYQLRLIIILMG